MWMSFFFDQYYKISGRSAAFACITFSTNAQLHSFLHACRDIYGNCFFSINTTFAFATTALIRYRCAFATTGGAGGYCLHLAKKCILHSSYLSAAMTCTTCLYAVLVFGAAALASCAFHMLF